MLIRPDAFQKRYFEPGQAPSLSTIRTWVRKGIVKGTIINTGQRDQFWVDAEAWELQAAKQPAAASSAPAAPERSAIRSRSDALADRIRGHAA